MKKKFLIFPALLLLASLLLFAGCESKFGYYANADRYNKGDGSAQNITEIDVEWVSGSVHISYAEQSEITFSEVSEQDDLSEDHIMRWLVNRSELSIKFAKSGANFYNACPSKTLIITLPAGTVLNKLNVKTVSAGIGGYVNAREADFESVSGAISITTANAPSRLKFETVSGNVDYSAENSMPTRIDAESVSGDFDLFLPLSASFYADLDSVSGKLRIDPAFNADNRVSTVVVNGGLNIVDVKTVSGNLRIACS